MPIQISPRVKAMLPTTFVAVPQRTKNLTEIERRVNGRQTAYVAITTEQRSDPAEAVRRLWEIASEANGKRTFLEICGWPALERVYSKPLAHVQSDEEANPEETRVMVHSCLSTEC